MSFEHSDKTENYRSGPSQKDVENIRSISLFGIFGESIYDFWKQIKKIFGHKINPMAVFWNFLVNF